MNHQATNASRRCVAAFVAGVAVFALSGCQPADETPGLWLNGETVSERVDDWSFASDVEEIFVETRPWYGIPHSTTIWCVEVGGELYIGSYGDEKKTWEKNLVRDPDVVLAISGKLYEVTLSEVKESGQVEALDSAYAQKYDMVDVFGEDVPDWWYYRIAARS